MPLSLRACGAASRHPTCGWPQAQMQQVYNKTHSHLSQPETRPGRTHQITKGRSPDRSSPPSTCHTAIPLAFHPVYRDPLWALTPALTSQFAHPQLGDASALVQGKPYSCCTSSGAPSVSYNFPDEPGCLPTHCSDHTLPFCPAWETFSIKGQRVHVLGPAGCLVSAPTTPLSPSLQTAQKKQNFIYKNRLSFASPALVHSLTQASPDTFYLRQPQLCGSSSRNH